LILLNKPGTVQWMTRKGIVPNRGTSANHPLLKYLRNKLAM